MPTRTAPRQTRDALGFRLCRMPQCGKRVGKGRRSYCSEACATAFAIAYFPQDARRHVFARDKGVCAKCRCDTEKLRRILRYVRWGRVVGSGRGDWMTADDVARELGFNGAHQPGDLWQVDHVTEVARGGWGAGLDQLRTLCTPCHKEETARLVRELAAERRANREAPLFTGVSA